MNIQNKLTIFEALKHSDLALAFNQLTAVKQ